MRGLMEKNLYSISRQQINILQQFDCFDIFGRL